MKNKHGNGEKDEKKGVLESDEREDENIKARVVLRHDSENHK